MDGNCWYHSVVQQLSRPEIASHVAAHGRPELLAMDHLQLREEISDNVKDIHENCHYINEYKRLQLQRRGVTWDQYFEEQSSPGMSASDLFVRGDVLIQTCHA